jgi:flagellar biosynthetic protein FliQ
MNDVAVVDVLRQMLISGVKIIGPVLVVTLVVGVVVSLAQTITQIQEQSVAFVLKIAAVAVVFVVAGPWMLQEMRGFVIELWARIGPTI